MRKNRLAVASIALALVGLNACSDSPLEPTITPTIAKPSFVISDTPPITPVAGQVHVCKVWDGASGTGPVVTTTANPVRSTLTINAANIPALGATCVLVATSTASNQDANAGWDEDHIIVTETPAAGTEFVTGKVFFSGGVQLPENFASTTRNQTFNLFHGAVIVFQNRVIPPPPGGCTYTKGWYQNKNGAPTIVLTIDGRTPDQQRAIFEASPGQPGGVTWPAGQNNVLNLYQQLLAALNNLDGNALGGPPSVDAAIAAALAATGGSALNITIAAGTDVGALITPLSDFNEGKVANFPHCD
jgi:hypothetical protein